MARLLLTALLFLMGCHTFYDPDEAPLSGESRDRDAGATTGDGATGPCTAESDWELCLLQGAQCGAITADDRCGTTREIECGECAPNRTCGAEEPNVCGCLCEAAVGCLAEGAPHPDGSCRVCGESGWEVVADAACSDGDLCTFGDVCQADGTCVGVPIDCSADECASGGSCDPDTGRCVFDAVMDGEACTDDGLDCTEDVCDGGRCQHRRVILTCIIDDVCVAQGETAPSTECLVCDAPTDPFGWTTVPDGSPCLGGTATCQSGECI